MLAKLGIIVVVCGAMYIATGQGEALGAAVLSVIVVVASALWHGGHE